MSLNFGDYLATVNLSLADLVGPERNENFVKVLSDLQSKWSTVKAKPETKADKVTPAYELAWQKDEAAKVAAHNIAVKMLTAIMQVEGSAATLYHLRNEIKTLVVGYASNEVDYQVSEIRKAEPKVASTSEKAEMAALYNAGKAGITTLYGYQGAELSIPGEYLTTTKDGELTPKLLSLQGNYGGNGTAGMNSKCYRINYTVGKTDLGSNPKAAIRAIWTGADRVGKTTTDLAKLLDEKAPTVWQNNEPVTFTVGKRAVTVQALTDDAVSDSEPDDEGEGE